MGKRLRWSVLLFIWYNDARETTLPVDASRISRLPVYVAACFVFANLYVCVCVRFNRCNERALFFAVHEACANAGFALHASAM